MNKEKKLEKEEIMKIVNEIDTIMFGNPQKLRFRKLNIDNYADGVYGAIAGVGCIVFADLYYSNISLMQHLSAIGIGYCVGVLISYCANGGNQPTHYYGYEKAFLNLSRQNQLKVLELSKNLVEQYKKYIKFDKNKKYVERYLYLDDENTMFNNFENNHPHFEALSQEKIDEIHKKGKLTPEESYNDWISYICAPGDGGGSAAWRCEKYGNCRDCLVAYAMEREEWSPLEFKNRIIFDRDIYYDRDTNSEVKKKVKE